ncbi:MAG TPA: hypothetical protein VF909_07005, partial [Roseiflexaceae bacterium]
DHWIIPSRTQMQGAGWPARLPDGVAHHYAPLARLDRRDGAWQIAQSEPPLFETAPDLSAQVKRQQQEIDAVRAALVHVEAMLAALQAEVDELRKAAAIARHRLSLDLHGAADLEIGDVVALEPTMEDYVVRANRMDEALVVGVVTGDAPGSQSDHKHYRIAIYGRAQCRVVGNVRPGDLLTTAETAGCAERAALYIQPGSIIGKAIKGHNPQRVNEIGLIDVLITLG